MNIRKPGTIKPIARQQLGKADQLRNILLIYCGILLGLSVLTTFFAVIVDGQMAGAGGLSKLGLRSLLSTIQTILPMVSTVITMMLDLGLLAAMLRIARGQYTSPQTLRRGLSRFFALLRCVILQGIVYVAIAVVTLYAATALFFLTPMSGKIMQLMVPLVTPTTDPYALMDTMMADTALMTQFVEALVPVYLIWIPLAVIAIAPVAYRFRVSRYIILDDPRAGAFKATFGSWALTRRNCMAFFKLDLSYWWYYGLLALSTAVYYGGNLLGIFGIALPWSADVSMYVFYGVYLLMEAAIYYFLRPQVEVSSILIYDAIRPKEEPKNQVVLGNIFQM